VQSARLSLNQTDGLLRRFIHDHAQHRPGPGALAAAEEAGATAVFLMANSYVNGQVITVDGGQGLM